MKVKILKILLNVLLYLVFVLLWGVIISVLALMNLFDTFISSFNDGILLEIFAITSVLGIVITILCRKKLKYKWMLPLLLIVSTIVTTVVNYGVLWCTYGYMSVYTREKWDKYPWERSCMVDNLNEQYEFIGMTEQEVIAVLGEPDRIFEYDGRTVYQYVIGNVFKERNAYDFVFENGIVVDTCFLQTRD